MKDIWKNPPKFNALEVELRGEEVEIFFLDRRALGKRRLYFGSLILFIIVFFGYFGASQVEPGEPLWVQFLQFSVPSFLLYTFFAIPIGLMAIRDPDLREKLSKVLQTDRYFHQIIAVLLVSWPIALFAMWDAIWSAAAKSRHRLVIGPQ